MPLPAPASTPPGALEGRFGRRAFLRGAAWTAATAASGGLLYRACFGSGLPAPGLLSLTQAELLTATAAAEAFFPKSEFPIDAAEADVPAFLDRYVHEMPRPKGKLFKLLLRSLEYSPAVSIRSLTRFSRLSIADRKRVLEAWEHSPVYGLRTGHWALLFACSSGYFECDAVLQQMGWGLGCILPPRQPGALL